APTCRQASVSGGQGGLLRPGGGLGSWREPSPQRLLALARGARPLLAGTVVVSLRHAGPRGQTRRGLKACHSDPARPEDARRPRRSPPGIVSSSATARVNVKTGGTSGAVGRLPPAVAPADAGAVSVALRAARLVAIAVLSASLCSSRQSIGASWMANKRRG